MVMSDEERKIIQAEIEALERRHESAHERYGMTGSASSDRTVYKLQVLIDALHETLYHNREDATDKALIRERETLQDVRRQIEFFRAGNLITADVAESLLKIVMR